jgi:DNA replication protein DnaC
MEILEFNDKNTSSWLDRFKPMRINEIVGNYKAINQVIQWVKNFDKNRNEFFEKQKLLSISKANKKKKSKKDKTTKDSENQETVETVEEVENEDNLDEAEEETNAIPIFKGTFNNDKSSCLLVTGNHGVGKTCSVYAILNELGFTIQVVNFSRIKTNSRIKHLPAPRG